VTDARRDSVLFVTCLVIIGIAIAVMVGVI